MCIDSRTASLLPVLLLSALLLSAVPSPARPLIDLEASPGTLLLEAGPDGVYSLPLDGGGSLPLVLERRGSDLVASRIEYEPRRRTLRLTLTPSSGRPVSAWAVTVATISPWNQRLTSVRWIEDRSYDSRQPYLTGGTSHTVTLPVSLPAQMASAHRVVVEIAATIYGDNGFTGDPSLVRRLLHQRRAVAEARTRWLTRLESALDGDGEGIGDRGLEDLLRLRRDLEEVPEGEPAAVGVVQERFRRALDAAITRVRSGETSSPLALEELRGAVDRRLEAQLRHVPRDLPAFAGPLPTVVERTEHDGGGDPAGDPDLSCNCGGSTQSVVTRVKQIDCDPGVQKYNVTETWTWQCLDSEGHAILSPQPGTLIGLGQCIEAHLCIPDRYCPPAFSPAILYEDGGSRFWSRTVQHDSVLVGPCTSRCSGDGGITVLETSCNCDPMPAPRCLVDGCPVLIETGAGGFQLTGLDRGVMFDLDADGAPNRVAWTAAGGDDAWLVLDRNGNGVIDDATELFGDKTPQPHSHTPNGFLALAVFDAPEEGGDGDGFIGAGDEVFERLRLWLDRDHDGFSDGDELLPLPAAGIAAIDLTYFRSVRQDEHGNNFRYSTTVHLENGGRRLAVDVFLDYER